MSNQIEKAYINSFKAGFEQAFQQTNSRLRPFVTQVRQSAEFDYYDRIGLAEDMTEVSSRYGDNPVSDIPHDRRRIAIKEYELGKPIDEKDLQKVAMDPTSDYMTALVASAHRKVDDVIVSKLTSTAFTGKQGETLITFVTESAGKINVGAISNQEGNIKADATTAVTAGNVEGIYVSKTYNGTAAPADSGLTKAKLMGIRSVMLGLHAIDQDTTINFFCGRKQFDDLLKIDEVINGDYATRKRLEDGAVTTWMGFRFIHTERLPLNGAVRACFATLPKAFKLAIGTDIQAKMWRLPEKKNIPYIYVNVALGGSRMWGEVLAQVDCTEV